MSPRDHVLVKNHQRSANNDALYKQFLGFSVLAIKAEAKLRSNKLQGRVWNRETDRKGRFRQGLSGRKEGHR